VCGVGGFAHINWLSSSYARTRVTSQSPDVIDCRESVLLLGFMNKNKLNRHQSYWMELEMAN